MRFFVHFLNLSCPKYFIVVLFFILGLAKLAKDEYSLIEISEVKELQTNVEWMARLFRHTLSKKHIFVLHPFQEMDGIIAHIFFPASNIKSSKELLTN
jgi:hypothetical protein